MMALGVAEQHDDSVEQEILGCLRGREGGASASEIVQALEIKAIPEREIMSTLRWLLQNGELQMGAAMNLEIVD